MTLLVKHLDGEVCEVVVEGVAEPVEEFSTRLLAEADGKWITVDGDLITLRGVGREVVYRIGYRPPTDAIDDCTFVSARLISDTRPEPG